MGKKRSARKLHGNQCSAHLFGTGCLPNLRIAHAAPDGPKLVASGGGEKKVRLWDVQTGECVKVIETTFELKSACFSRSPDGRQLATGSSTNFDGIEPSLAQVWDVETGAHRANLPHDDWVVSVCFTRDGTQLASGGRDDEVRVWDADTGECVKKFSCDEHCEMRRKYWNPDESEPG